MGHSTSVDVVPFVVHNAFFVSDREEPQTEFDQMICCPEAYEEGEFCDNTKSVEQNGWVYRSFDRDERELYRVGKKKNVYGDIWEKEGCTVWIVNESFYSAVGEYDMCVVADDKDSIEMFVRDFNLSNPIDKMDAVQQSG